MDKFFKDYCPVLDDEYSICITYLKASTLRSQSYIKDTFRCKHSYQKGCPLSGCPIYEAAPDAL